MLQRCLHTLALSLIIVTGHAAALDTPQPTSRKPNILLIYSDDHGWSDLGAQGVNNEIRTPNLDRLTQDGVRFSRGYVSAPQCVPSRAGVITGRYQQRFGVEDNSKGPLPLDEQTIAERLKAAGYVSGWVGKCHLDIGGAKGEGKTSRVLPEHMPHQQGFDEYFRGEMRQFFASHDLRGNPFADAPRLVTDNRFRVEVQTEAALSFLDRRTNTPEQPWFLYLAWYAPHVPLESPEPWFSQTPKELPLPRRQALAMIAAMDDGLGRIRAKLREMQADQNTLIFFIGDNGAPLGNSWNGSLNTPLSGQKGMLAEGGIRTPFIAAWPGTWPAGVTYDQPVINLDVAATAAAVAGLPHDPALDGVNLTPYVTGQNQSAPHQHLFWRWGSQAAVLEHPYKLIKLGNRPPALFDVTNVDGENIERDLSAKHPEITERLLKRLNAWASELKPAGLSKDASGFSRHHEDLFVEHKIIAPLSVPADLHKPNGEQVASDGSLQGWIARNGTLAKRDGALQLLVPDQLPQNGRPFITNAHVDLNGPISVTLRVRASNAGDGKSSITWRTKEDSFAPHQTAEFQWPSGKDWQTVKVEVPETSRILHVRIQPPRNSKGIEIQSLEFQGKGTAKRAFDFSK